VWRFASAKTRSKRDAPAKRGKKRVRRNGRAKSPVEAIQYVISREFFSRESCDFCSIGFLGKRIRSFENKWLYRAIFHPSISIR
jgi:hypothetical protein